FLGLTGPNRSAEPEPMNKYRGCKKPTSDGVGSLLSLSAPDSEVLFAPLVAGEEDGDGDRIKMPNTASMVARTTKVRGSSRTRHLRSVTVALTWSPCCPLAGTGPWTCGRTE